jgi:hypothetical protein
MKEARLNYLFISKFEALVNVMTIKFMLKIVKLYILYGDYNEWVFATVLSAACERT